MKKKLLFIISNIVILLLVGCGQKGPLIVEVPASTSTAKTEREVSQDEPVLNTQTEETSSTR